MILCVLNFGGKKQAFENSYPSPLPPKSQFCFFAVTCQREKKETDDFYWQSVYFIKCESVCVGGCFTKHSKAWCVLLSASSKRSLLHKCTRPTVKWAETSTVHKEIGGHEAWTLRGRSVPHDPTVTEARSQAEGERDIEHLESIDGAHGMFPLILDLWLSKLELTSWVLSLVVSGPQQGVIRLYQKITARVSAGLWLHIAMASLHH